MAGDCGLNGIVYMRLRPSPWMGPLLRMQARLHFEDCRKMCCLNGSRKLHFVQKIRIDRII